MKGTWSISTNLHQDFNTGSNNNDAATF